MSKDSIDAYIGAYMASASPQCAQALRELVAGQAGIDTSSAQAWQAALDAIVRQVLTERAATANPARSGRSTSIGQRGASIDHGLLAPGCGPGMQPDVEAELRLVRSWMGVSTAGASRVYFSARD